MQKRKHKNMAQYSNIQNMAWLTSNVKARSFGASIANTRVLHSGSNKGLQWLVGKFAHIG